MPSKFICLFYGKKYSSKYVGFYLKVSREMRFVKDNIECQNDKELVNFLSVKTEMLRPAGWLCG